MCKRILVIGFQRSGTTLMRRVIHHHPNVVRCIHEKRVIRKRNTKKEIYDYINNRLGMTDVTPDVHWGEKVPWYDGTGDTIIKYANKWLSIFGEDARIVHIYRHPKDVANSNINKGWATNISAVISMQKSSVKKVDASLSNYDRYISVRFEDLVTDPEQVATEIFKFCGLDYSRHTIKNLVAPDDVKWRFFDRINPERAFAYKGGK